MLSQSDSTIDNQWETIKTTITIAAKATIGKREIKTEMDYTTYAAHGGKKAVETTDDPKRTRRDTKDKAA